MWGIGPAGDDRGECLGIDEVVLLDDEIRTFEESGHSTAKEQRTYDAIEREEELKGLWTEDVANLILELVADSL